MTVQAVIPTIPGREALLAAATASFESVGVEPLVVADSLSCGWGWKEGLDRATADHVLFAADDVECRDGWPGLGTATARMSAGFLVCPPLYWPDDTLQGSGGWELTIGDGEPAGNCCFPFGRRDVLRSLWPWPQTNHHCDSWVSELALSRRLGPIVTVGIDLTHKVANTPADAELEQYLAWRKGQLHRLGDPETQKEGRR